MRRALAAQAERAALVSGPVVATGRQAHAHQARPFANRKGRLVLGGFRGDTQRINAALHIVEFCRTRRKPTKKSDKRCFCFDHPPYEGAGGQFGGNKYHDCITDAECNAFCKAKNYEWGGKCFPK